MVDNIKKIVQETKIIAEGDYNSNIIPRSKKDELGNALQKMTKSLREAAKESKLNSWFKTNQTELADQMRGDKDINTLAMNIITYLAKILDSQIGTFYVAEDNGILTLAGSYAFVNRKELRTKIKPGESLVGQAASEKSFILISEVPEDYISINSSLVHAVPKTILAFPFVLGNQVIAVIELGSFKDFSDVQIKFLEIVSENIAIAINSAINRRKTKALIEKIQHQSEKRQV